MLSDYGIEDAGYRNRRDCVRDYNASGKFPSWPIFSVQMRSPTEADVVHRQRRGLDAGNDNLALRHEQLRR